MAKKKSKELLLAEIAYADGRASMFENDDDISVKQGPEVALAKWKKQTGGRKPEPTEIQLARHKWIAEGSPKEGTHYAGACYVFAPDGSFNLVDNFYANLGRDVAKARK